MNCPLKILGGGVHGFRGSLREEITPAKVVFISLRIQAFVGNRTWHLLPGKRRLDVAGNVLGNVALQLQHVSQIALV